MAGDQKRTHPPETAPRGPTSPSGRTASIPLDATKLTLLLNAAKAMASTTDPDELLNVIVREVRQDVDCEGAGVALYDEEMDDFYWRAVEDTESLLSSARDAIRIPKDRGVAGHVFETGEPALVRDAANDPRIYRPVEDKSGFRTRNMICVPLKTREKRLGVLYAMNKRDGDFTEEDVEVLTALSGTTALALENAAQHDNLIRSHRELERLNRVKNKILNHLSHELKTPVAIIEASLRILERRLRTEGFHPEAFAMERIHRNLGRLKMIERQVGQIVEEKEYPEREIITQFLEHLQDLMDMQKADKPWMADALDALRERVEEIFPTRIEEKEGVSIQAAFQAAQFRVERAAGDRRLDIEFVPPQPALIKMQPHIFMSVLGGLIRNAVENTPDGGRIVVSGENFDGGYRVVVHDYGVGIPESEQPNIFEGFYPVQEPDMYSSGSRYAFNAGGTGTDLLKIKIFSKRCGFNVRFNSARCSWIPTTRDLCPGSIEQCRHCRNPEDCYGNGGTEFVVEIPPELVEQEAEAVA